MVDSSGNYIVQEVFKLCTDKERIVIIDKIGSKIIDLSCHKKGTHSIQTLVEVLKSENEIKRFHKILEPIEFNNTNNEEVNDNVFINIDR
jgi:hypothetical protein